MPVIPETILAMLGINGKPSWLGLFELEVAAKELNNPRVSFITAKMWLLKRVRNSQSVSTIQTS